MKSILDYSEFVTELAHNDRGDYEHGTNINNHFFGKVETGCCPFCRTTSEQVHTSSRIDHPEWLDGGYQLVNEKVWFCSGCGWWKVRTDRDTTGNLDSQSAVIKNAVLRKYDLSSKEIPITVLQKYLSENFSDVTEISSYNMEKLVQSVFSEHFTCDVELLGQSRDGGIDLWLIDSESPTVVQVKRRKSLEHTEAVAGIREFLGAALLAESKNCIYVSTCNRFSPDAINAASRYVELGTVDSYELFDFSRFLSALKLTNVARDKPEWEKYINIE